MITVDIIPLDEGGCPEHPWLCFVKAFETDAQPVEALERLEAYIRRLEEKVECLELEIDIRRFRQRKAQKRYRDRLANAERTLGKRSANANER